MKINIRNIFKAYMLVIFLIVFIIFCLKSVEVDINVNLEILFTFIVIATIIIMNIVIDNKKYSLNKVFWYFSFFFMFIAPLFQYITGYKQWNHFLSDENILKANYSLIIWFLLYAITYKLIKNKENREKKTISRIKLKNTTLNFFIICSFVAFGVAVVLIGFKSLFVRAENQTNFEMGFVNTTISNFIRTVPVYSIAYAMYYYKKNKVNMFKIIVLIILLLCLNFPVSTTRYWIGSVYIGIALIAFGKYLGTKTFDIGIIFVFAVIFPIFQLFKWYTLTDLITGTATINLIKVYNNPDFDAYSLFVRTFEYINDFGITYGKQLFTTILFFIPRVVWPTKSVPTGELVATAQNQAFTNLSAPLQAEGLINFGYLGIIFYAIILAVITKKMDLKYWEQENDGTRFIDYIYPFCMGLFIFLLRGAFHSVVVLSFTFFIFMIIWKVFYIIKIKQKDKEKISNKE